MTPEIQDDMQKYYIGREGVSSEEQKVGAFIQISVGIYA